MVAHPAIPRSLLALARIWTMPLWWRVCRDGFASIIWIDVDRWVECIGNPSLVPLSRRDRFAYLAGALPEFRSLVHIRLAGSRPLVDLVLRRVYRGRGDLVIKAGSIGPGLFIHHGNGSIIIANSIGARCWINQHVSLGHGRHGIPTLEDDVTVAAGAVVTGPITLGAGSTIGPNAVVHKSVTPGSLLVAPMATALKGGYADRPGSVAD